MKEVELLFVHKDGAKKAIARPTSCGFEVEAFGGENLYSFFFSAMQSGTINIGLVYQLVDCPLYWLSTSKAGFNNSAALQELILKAHSEKHKPYRPPIDV